MSRRTLPVSGIPEDFKLTEKTIATVEREYPTVDIAATLIKFVRKAEAGGWMYARWQSAFLNYLDNGQKYGGIAYKVGRAADPIWKPVLAEAGQYGFRLPFEHETPGSYRTQFHLWKDEAKRESNNVASLAAHSLKRVSR